LQAQLVAFAQRDLKRLGVLIVNIVVASELEELLWGAAAAGNW
jgi:hypothetical protein